MSNNTWDGSETGDQLVHTIFCSDESDWGQEREKGKKYVQDLIPGSKVRVGCTCCYGDGPDINTYVTKVEGGWKLEFWVNFNFKVDE